MMNLLKSVVRSTVFTPVRRIRRQIRHARRQRDETRLVALTGLTVLSGPFTGLNLTGACSPIGPKLLGTHELELSPLIETITRGAVQHVVNVGAADGFYAVGLLTHLPDARGTAFELLTSHHRSIELLGASNNVLDRLAIHGACDAGALASALRPGERTLVLMDVEGAERDLLDLERVPQLRNVHILVEVHDFVDPQISALLRRRFEGTHRLTVVRSRRREIADLPSVGGADRAMLLRLADEGRPARMEWFWLEPREHGTGAHA